MAAEADVLKLSEANRLLDKARFRRRLVFVVASGLFLVITIGALLATTALIQTRVALTRATEARFQAAEAQSRAQQEALALQRSFPIKAIGSGGAISQEGWLIKDGRPVRQIADGPIYLAVFGPDQNEFAVVTENGVFVGHTTDQSKALPLPVDSPVTSISFSPDGRHIVTGGSNGTVDMWDASTRQRLASLRTAGLATAATFSPDGQLVAVGTSDGKVRIWDHATGRPIGTPITAPSAASSFAFSVDGRSLLVGTQGGGFSVFDVATGNLIARFPG
jgi:WD domain, G-beta repeat